MAEPEAKDMVDEVDGSAGSTGRSSRRRRLILIAGGAAVALVLAGGAGSYFAGVFDPFASAEASSTADAAKKKPARPPVLYDLPEFVVNLNVPGRKSRFLKLTSRLELSAPGDVAVVEAALPRIVDVFQVYLRELRPEDLQGSAGTYRLREALVRRIGAEIGRERVHDLLFVDLFVQ